MIEEIIKFLAWLRSPHRDLTPEKKIPFLLIHSFTNQSFKFRKKMTEKLTIFSTIEDLKNASDEVLKNDIDAVGRDVVLEYILELRRNVQQNQLG